MFITRLTQVSEPANQVLKTEQREASFRQHRAGPGLSLTRLNSS